MNKMANHVLDVINGARDDWEAAERSGPPPTFNNADTQELVTALATGRAFKIVPVPQLARQTSTPTSTTSPGNLTCIIPSNLVIIIYHLFYSSSKRTRNHQNQHKKCAYFFLCSKQLVIYINLFFSF